MRFNVLFRMALKRDPDSFSFETDTTTIGTDTHFQFSDEEVVAKGPDINLSYPRSRVKSFMASWM